MTMPEKIPLAFFVDTFKNSHGPDGAEKLLSETLKSLGFEQKTTFSIGEAIVLCKELQNQSGFVGIVAGLLLTRFKKDYHEPL